MIWMRWSTCSRARRRAIPRSEVLVTGLNGSASVTVRTWAPDADGARAHRERPPPPNRCAGFASRASCEPPARQRFPPSAARRPSDTPGRRRKRRRARARAPPQARHRRLPRSSRSSVSLGAVGFQQRPRDPARLRPERPPACVDRRQLVHLRGRRLPARLDSGREEPPAGEPGARRARGWRRRRSPSRTGASTSTAASTSRASRGRRYNDIQGGPHRRGRLDDHAAARPQPLHQAPRADPQAQGRRGLPRRQAEPAPRSRDWILANYMNTVYYGNHAYGVEAAAQTYFSRRAKKLSLLQAALLAGLPAGPVGLRPVQEPGARDRAPKPRPRGALRER